MNGKADFLIYRLLLHFTKIASSVPERLPIVRWLSGRFEICFIPIIFIISNNGDLRILGYIYHRSVGPYMDQTLDYRNRLCYFTNQRIVPIDDKKKTVFISGFFLFVLRFLFSSFFSGWNFCSQFSY